MNPNESGSLENGAPVEQNGLARPQDKAAPEYVAANRAAQDRANQGRANPERESPNRANQDMGAGGMPPGTNLEYAIDAAARGDFQAAFRYIGRWLESETKRYGEHLQ